MKILFVNEKCGYWGGVEQNIADTARGLMANGHVCALAYSELTQRNAAQYQQIFQSTWRCQQIAGQGIDWQQIVQETKPDVVYLHKVPSINFCLTKSPRYARMIRMIHDHDLCCPRRHKYFAISGRVCHYAAGWRCWLDGAFLGRGSGALPLRWVSIPNQQQEMQRNQQLDLLLVGSRFMQEELLVNGFAAEKIKVLAPVVPTLREQQMPTPATQTNRILYVGQLIRGKGVDLLLQALKLLAARCEFHATIIGTGNAQHQLQALAQSLDLSHRVKFLGWVNHEQLVGFYQEHSICVVPSRWPEPFGMIGLEAMQQARAVVGFAVGGIPDWLQHEVTGLLVPEQDVAGLASALHRLIESPELAIRLGQNGYREVQSKYSFKQYLSQLENYLLPLPTRKFNSDENRCDYVGM